MNSNKNTNSPKYTIRQTCRTCLKSFKNNIMESIFGLQSNDIESFRIMDELIIMNLKVCVYLYFILSNIYVNKKKS